MAQASDYIFTTNNVTITITKYTGLGGDVTLPDRINDLPVTSIGGVAFVGCNALTRVIVPNSVTSIEGQAFQACTRLTQVTIPRSVARIGHGAFQYCTSLADVMIPDSVTYLGGGAFRSCTSLTNVVLGSSIADMGDEMFAGCTSLVRVTMPQGINSLGIAMFSGCSSLDQVIIPDSVTSVGSFAFSGCTRLTSLIIPGRVDCIGDGAFGSCASLASIVISKKVSRIGVNVFENCPALTAISVDAENRTYCSIDGVLFDKSRTLLIQCPRGKSGAYSIPEGVTSIGNGALSGCANLTQITIPASLSCIALSEFNGCIRLAAISVDSLNPIFSSVDGVLFNKNRTMLVRFPMGRAGAYTVPDRVIRIMGSAFSSCGNLSTVTIPHGIISIGNMAFPSCTNLLGVYFKGNAPGAIGKSIFSCSSNVTVYFEAGASGYEQVFGGRPTKQLPSMKAGASGVTSRTGDVGRGGYQGLNTGSDGGRALAGAKPEQGRLIKNAESTIPRSLNFSSNIYGTWELIDISAFTVIDSPPKGFAAHKAYFARDGKMRVIEHDAELLTNTVCVPFVLHNSLMKLTVPEGGELTVPVEFAGSNRMVLVHGSRNRWTYRKLGGEKSCNQKIEPRSVAVLQTKDPKRQLTSLDIHYDTSDYSSLKPIERVVGIWEVTAYAGVSSQNFPPYGFPNEKWVFTKEGKWYVLAPDAAGVSGAPVSSYAVVLDRLILNYGGNRSETNGISFNEWGHLVVEKGGVQVALKLLSKDTGTIQELPAKIVLLKLQGE